MALQNTNISFLCVIQIEVVRQPCWAVKLSVVIQEAKHILSHGFAILEFFTSAVGMRKRGGGR